MGNSCSTKSTSNLLKEHPVSKIDWDDYCFDMKSANTISRTQEMKRIIFHPKGKEIFLLYEDKIEVYNLGNCGTTKLLTTENEDGKITNLFSPRLVL